MQYSKDSGTFEICRMFVVRQTLQDGIFSWVVMVVLELSQVSEAVNRGVSRIWCDHPSRDRALSQSWNRMDINDVRGKERRVEEDVNWGSVV